jgi:HK97 gp10 family phage protein
MSRRLPKAASLFSATAEVTVRSVEAMSHINEAVFAATKEVFAEITEAAKDRSPVIDKATRERYAGENRDSIGSKVTRVKKGVHATLFTKDDVQWGKSDSQRGYGGFLELGTVRTKAEPYLWPAFEEHIGELPAAVKQNLDEITNG